jgi:Heterokaryon incompatibility protein (HET)
MRLLEDDGHGNLNLVEKHDSDIPRYAILSHTWGADGDEVTFRDLTEGTGRNKAGYKKIEFCRARAASDGLQYFWVDTCCINKANHTELSEAITSMFRWYRDAVKCYVYLSDVPTCTRDHDSQTEQAWQSAFRISRWFTRGWTLQELLAPRCVEFFSREEKLLGNKKTLEELIHDITDIPITALQGAPLSGFLVDERLLWAAKRDTKKKEDKAYSLLGIFNVFMPLIYGEEENAFIRLKEEIDKRSVEKSTASPSPSSTVPFRRDADFVDRRASHDGSTLLEKIEQRCGTPAARVALVGIGGAG